MVAQDTRAASPGWRATRGEAQAVQRRLDAAHQRWVKAVKTLAQIRKLGVPVVQINLAAQQTNVAG